MSNENREEFDEMRRLEERLEELRAEGILSGSPNPKKVVDTEPSDLATQIAKLEAQGIVSGSRGARGSLWNMPQQDE